MNISKLTLDTSKHKYFRSNGWEKVAGIIPESYKQRYLALYEANKDNKIENKTTVYSTPLSELPSYKLKNYIDENKLNIKTARKFDKLDAVIISDNFIKDNYLDLKTYMWDSQANTSYYVPKQPDNFYLIPAEFIVNNPKFLKYRNQTTSYGQSNDIIKDRKGDLYTHYIILDKELDNWIKILDSNFETIKQYSPITGHIITNHHGNTKACKNIDFFLNLIDNIEKYNLKVIFDTSVNNEINQGIVVDFDIYQNLYNMLNSSDAENWEMAREIAANCEYETSKPYLMYLYCSFSQLRKSNGSTNYQFLKKRLDKEAKLSSYGRNNNPTFAAILKHLATQHPDHNQIFLSCFKYQVNMFIGKDVIKEITSY